MQYTYAERNPGGYSPSSSDTSLIDPVPLDRAPSAALSRAATRGVTKLEQKASWPFDYYQAGNFFMVDYQYWQTPYACRHFKTALTTVQAVALTDDLSEFAADQMIHRRNMRDAHKLAQGKLYTQSSLRFAGQE